MTTSHVMSLIEEPAEWSPAYSEDDKAKVRKVVEWINAGQVHEPGYAHKRSQSKLAQQARVPQSTLNRILRGNYTSPPTQQLDAVVEAITRDGERPHAARPSAMAGWDRRSPT